MTKAHDHFLVDSHPSLVERGEFWTASQRQMHSLHYVISYRAAFKPELPDFFIQRFSKPGDTVLDPFGGRGTTLLQANLLGRSAIHCDANPISVRVALAKSHPVEPAQVEAVLDKLNLKRKRDLTDFETELLVFYSRQTLTELLNLRDALRANPGDPELRFIELIALSRLHGHSDGFFSVYTFPQISVPIKAQQRINRERGQKPQPRPIAPRIAKKARQTLKSGDIPRLRFNAKHNRVFLDSADRMKKVKDESVDLLVTSPPFLDKVNYVQDNWLKAWFLGIDESDLKKHIVQTPSVEAWRQFMGDMLRQTRRVLKPGARAVVEVGEVAKGDTVLNLDEMVCELGMQAGLQPEKVFIHEQKFTKLSHCFSVVNNQKGTNTNRCVLLRKVS